MNPHANGAESITVGFTERYEHAANYKYGSEDCDK
jgi:hypothetical protein